MNEEETPQERFARLRARSKHQFTKPKSLYEALQSASVADYERLRVLLEALAEWDENDANEVLLSCPWCRGAHEEHCPVTIATKFLEQLPPAMPRQLPPRDGGSI